MLADQKLNEGKLINFLGHPAKTATAIAELSIKLSLPIVPVHVIRVKGPTFKYVAEKPFSSKTQKQIDNLMRGKEKGAEQARGAIRTTPKNQKGMRLPGKGETVKRMGGGKVIKTNMSGDDLVRGCYD